MRVGTFTTADGCKLAFVDEGQGLPVLWQHGLGADRTQPAEVFPTIDGVRRITLECRGHGQSALGSTRRISIVQFARDAKALLDHLEIDRAVVGGISLGAAIGLRLAARHPELTCGLILARPAWVDEMGPDHLRIYRVVAKLIETCGVEDGRRRFEREPWLAAVEAVSPDNAVSMRWFFERPNPDSTVALLSRIPAKGPGISRAQMMALRVPTLVIGNDQDYVHSLATAHELATLIPGATETEITSKTIDRSRYVAEFKQALKSFLTRQVGARA